MNLEFVDPFAANYPDAIEFKLSHDGAFFCSFSPTGTLIVSACIDGSCLLWDFESRAVITSLVGHVAVISSLSWAFDGQFLLTSSRDWNCILWNLTDFTKEAVFRFSSPIVSSAIHPSNEKIAVVCPQGSHPFFVQVAADGKERRKAILIGGAEGLNELSSAGILNSYKDLVSSRKVPVQATVVSFDRAGNRIYFGTAKGTLLVYDTETLACLNSMKITAGTSAIKNIQFSQQGREVVINSADKAIRCYTITGTETHTTADLKHKFLDSIDQNRWVQCCFSADAEYIVGGSAAKHVHKIFLWEKASGALVKILEGPKEGLSDLSWHPYRPILASVSTFGAIYVWTVTVHENWSAFAPDFEELEDNIEYEEKEDEFDIIAEREDVKPTRQKALIAEEAVDVVTVDPNSLDLAARLFIPGVHSEIL
ncbi:WD40-repeat-containing domain protein [Zopfochytrium polystomum]|nr:WD40-repeat-containing domain protein [Zopfochytrium polystomum]